MMIFEENMKTLKIGFKQVKRAITEGMAKTVYIAEDCDERFKNELLLNAQSERVEIIYTSTMKELGKMCNIDVGASCAVILKD